MKYNLLFAFFMSMLFLTACSNEFDVTAPWKDIPVVYGLLNVSDDVHYIRVEKAFLDPESNALTDAQIVDSLYYANPTVQLQRVSNGQTFTLTRVDGNDPNVNLPRDPGVFATDPNWVYRIGAGEIDLQPKETILFMLDRGNGSDIVTAEAAIQGPMVKRTPLGNNFDFVPNVETNLGWSASEEAKIFDAKLVLNYAEFPKDEPDEFVEKSIDWIWGKGVSFTVFTNEYKLSKDGTEFYQIMASSIEEDPNFKRIFIDIDIEIESGGEGLEKYINVALANSGITGSQELPSFSNLSEGMGVFSTKGSLNVKGLSLTPRTRDSLVNGSLTKLLNFQ